MNSSDPVNGDNSVPPRIDRRVWVGCFLLLLMLALAVIFFLSPHSRPAAPLPEMNRTNLVRLDGRWCVAGHTNPFTGVLQEFYADGTMESRSMVSNGWLEGLSEGWFTNRQMQIREYYRTNFSNGRRTKWFPDGKTNSEATIVAGKIEGVFRRWHDNGRLAEEIQMRDGKIEGIGRAYYESGSLKTKLTMHDGQVIEAKSWPDGTPGEKPAPK